MNQVQIHQKSQVMRPHLPAHMKEIYVSELTPKTLELINALQKRDGVAVRLNSTQSSVQVSFTHTRGVSSISVWLGKPYSDVRLKALLDQPITFNPCDEAMAVAERHIVTIRARNRAAGTSKH